MQTRTADAPSVASGLDDLRQTLPSLVVGEAGEVERKHEWPGALFVVLSYITAVGLMGSAIGSAAWGLIQGRPELLGWAAAAAAGSVLQARLAKLVDRFRRWGWFGAMAEVGAAAAAKVWAFSTTGDMAGPVMGLVMDVIWISYFWKRRRDFDVDEL